MTGKISLLSQISAVQTAAEGRLPSSGSARDLLEQHLKAALSTLQFVKMHEQEFRAYMAARKGDRP